MVFWQMDLDFRTSKRSSQDNGEDDKPDGQGIVHGRYLRRTVGGMAACARRSSCHWICAVLRPSQGVSVAEESKLRPRRECSTLYHMPCSEPRRCRGAAVRRTGI